MIRKIVKTYSTTYVYQLSGGASVASAIQWICSLVNPQTIVTDRIVLRDTQRRNDEGNTTVEVFLPLNVEDILEQVRRLDTDSITLSGSLQQIPLAIHLSLQTFQVGIAMDNASLMDADLLEAALHLR